MKRAVALPQHAVLVVAEVGGAEPERAVVLEGEPALASSAERVLDPARVVDRLLGRHDVEPDAEVGEVAVLLLPLDPRARGRAARRDAVGVGRSAKARALGVEHVARVLRRYSP